VGKDFIFICIYFSAFIYIDIICRAGFLVCVTTVWDKSKNTNGEVHSQG